MVRFGYKASAEQFAPAELLRFAVVAEEVGFDSVFVSDHLQPWRHDGGHAPAALPWLGALGARTDHVTIGTSVLTPTFRYHPAVVAQAFATLGCLYPGRVVLGIGSGESMNEAPLGVDWPESKERFARFKEAIEVIELLWSQDRVDYDGTYYQVRKATIYDRPEPHVPLYIAGSPAPPPPAPPPPPGPPGPRPGSPAGAATGSSPPAARTRRSTPRRGCRRCARARRRPAGRSPIWTCRSR